MFTWVERLNLPEYTHEMIHYRNAMVKEVNFAFSDQYSKLQANKNLLEQFERFKDHREKTGNRIQKDSSRNRVWLDMLIDIFKSTFDFTAADLFIKYFNIPNEAVNTDFYFIMKEDNSVFHHLIKDESFNTAFQFLHFFPPSEALAEFQYLLKTAIDRDNEDAIYHLVDNILLEPFNNLLKDDETRNLLKKEYEIAEKEKRIAEARKIAQVLKDADLTKRVDALDAMVKNNYTDAINHLKGIANFSGFKPIVKEFFDNAIGKGEQTQDNEQYKIAFSYAIYGKLDDDDKKYSEIPAGKLFEYYVTKPNASEVDYYEAEHYRDSCNESFVQNAVAKKMLELIHNNDRTHAKKLKNRYKIVFQTGGYKFEEDIKKYYRNLTETYGSFDVPKGEENLQTALDIAEFFNFHPEEIDNIKFLLCKFYIINKIFESAKKYYTEKNPELYELILKQLNSFIAMRDYGGAYGLFEAIPITISKKRSRGKTKRCQAVPFE